MKNIKVVAILIKDRIKEANRTQTILSNYGHIIQNRIGFHEVNDDICSREGTLILHIKSKQEELQQLMNELSEVGGIDAQSISFE